jgi:tetraprenyl-beta-curcumene synthase
VGVDSSVAALSYRRVIQAAAFARAAHRYWFRIFPRVQVELGEWRRRAEQIPDCVLRKAAFDGLLSKSGDLEGATAFAAFVPSSLQREVVRAITAFEIAFDYLDSVVELPSQDPIANGRSLNKALLVALSPGTHHLDYYRCFHRSNDAGYLEALVQTCQAALGSLPSCAAVAEPMYRALSRITTYQSLSHGDATGSRDAFHEWACSQTVRGAGLYWWEMAAAAGSQLPVLALIAAAGDPTMSPEQAAALEQAYFPWIGSLSTLLDSVVDQQIDRDENQQSLVDYYHSPRIAADRLRIITVEGLDAVASLPDTENHRLILAAMAAFFHSTPQAATPEVGIVTRAVFDAMGIRAIPAFILLRARRAWAREPQTYSEASYIAGARERPHDR